MNSDQNWKETRVTAQDLSLLLGVSIHTVEDFLLVVENLIIHQLVETLSTEDDLSNKDISIELPYLGTLVISLDNKRNVSTSFMCRSSFYNKIKQACCTLKSPLISQVSKVLGDHLATLFDSGELGQ